MKFLIFLHEQCAITNPNNVRNWDKEMSSKFIDKEFLNEQILCCRERKRNKKRIPPVFTLSAKHLGCMPFNYYTHAKTFEDERFFAITLATPPGALRFSHQHYGTLLKVDDITLECEKFCKVTSLGEKNQIKIPSGIFINTSRQEPKCDNERNSIEIYKNAPTSIAPEMKKILDLVLKTRYEVRMKNVFLDLENLKLDENIPSHINIGCITPTSTIFSIVHFSDLAIQSELYNVMQYKLTCIYVAFAYSRMFKYCNWSPRILDDILVLAKDNIDQGLNTEFVIQRHYIKLEHIRPVIVGRLNSRVKNSFNIYQGLLHFFLKSVDCIFYSEHHYFLISRHNRSFYVYDPTGRLENIRTDEKYGLPCLIRLDNLCNVTYLILKLSNLFDNSPFTLSEIKQTEYFEISLKNCEIIKQRLKTAIEHVEPVEEEEVIYDLDQPHEFVVVQKESEPFHVTDSQLSNFDLVYWNQDSYNNKEIVKKFIEQLLLGIHSEPHVDTQEEFIDKVIDFIIDQLMEQLKKEKKIIVTPEEKAVDDVIDNYIEMPNNTAMIVTTKEIQSDMDLFSVNLSFVAVFLAHGKISRWDSNFLNYIYRISYAVQSYFSPKKEKVVSLNKFFCSIQLGCDEIAMAFTQIVKTHYEHLRGYLLNDLRKSKILLVISDTVIFVIIKHKKHYYYFDGNLRDSLEIWEYVQHQFGCIIRFKTLYEILTLIKRYNNKKFDFYHIFQVENEKWLENDFYEDFISVNLYKYHRTNNDGLFKIQGNTCLPDRSIITVDLMRPCYFTAIYIIMFITRLPLARWNADIIDLAIKHGPLLERQLRKLNGTNIFYQKRFIENLAIEGYHFNIFIQEVFADTYSQELLSQLKYFFAKRNILILQFINTSFVILKDFGYHLFDPYGSLELSQEEEEIYTYKYPEYCYSANNDTVIEDNNKASWVYFMDLNDVIEYIKPRSILDENTKKGYQFWIINIVSYKPIYNQINRGIELKPENSNYRCITFDYSKSLHINNPNEHLKWIKDGEDYIPMWSRLLIKNKRTRLIKNSVTFGTELQFQWFNFEIEKENDIFSIWGTISPRTYVFGVNRNRQYHAIYIMASFIMNIYTLSELTTQLIDFIVIEGDRYFNYSVEHIETRDYEVSIDDMIKHYTVGNFQFTWSSLVLSCNNGILYKGKSSLTKLIELFFVSHKYKHGIIECNEKMLAFGVDVKEGFYVYDAQSFGLPLFLDCQGTAYLLRCLSLKRLTYLIVRALGIYETDHTFVLHALSFDIKLRDAKFYKGSFKRERIFVERPIRPECIEKAPEPEPEPEKTPPTDPFAATRMT